MYYVHSSCQYYLEYRITAEGNKPSTGRATAQLVSLRPDAGIACHCGASG